MAPCNPTTFQRAILSEQDIVNSRCPCRESDSGINIAYSLWQKNLITCITPSHVWMPSLLFTGMVPSPDSIFVRNCPRAFLKRLRKKIEMRIWVEWVVNGALFEFCIQTDSDAYRRQYHLRVDWIFGHRHMVLCLWTDETWCHHGFYTADFVARVEQKLNLLQYLKFGRMKHRAMESIQA